MKKGDLFLVVLGFAAMIGAAVVLYLQFNQKDPVAIPSFLANQGVTVVGVLRDTDCIDCVEKLVCQWSTLTAELDPEGRLDFVLLMGYDEAFELNEMEAMCPIPPMLATISNADMSQIIQLPTISPSVGIFFNGRIVSMDPIFVNTDMPFYINSLRDTILNLEAGAGSHLL